MSDSPAKLMCQVISLGSPRKPGGIRRNSWVFFLSLLAACAMWARETPPSATHSSLPVSATSPAVASSEASSGVSLDDIFLWLAGGISSPRIQRLTASEVASGSGGHVSPACIKALRAGGADDDLIRHFDSIAPHWLATQTGLSNHLAGTAVNQASCARPAAEIAFLVHVKNWSGAEAAVRAQLTDHPKDARLHFVLGVILRSEERFDEAYDAFADSVHLEPGFPETHNQLSYLFYRSNDSDNAIAEARTALSIDPANAQAYRYLGLALYSEGHYDAALNAYEKSLEREPENADVYFDLGVTNRDKGDLRQAAVAYRHALRLRSDYWQAHSNLGVVLHDEGKLDEAIVEYRIALKLKPDEASVRNNLGNTLCDKEDFDGALAEFQQLYRQKPDWNGGHNCLARVYMSKRNYPAAILELQEAIADNPEGATERRVLGQALLLSGKDQEAVEVLRKAVELNPRSALGHHYLGTALVNTQQYMEAEKEFREALKLEANAQNHYSLAACLMALNRFEEALGELEIASRLDPGEKLYRARMQEAARMITTTK